MNAYSGNRLRMWGLSLLVCAALLSGCAKVDSRQSAEYTTRDLNEQLVMSTLWMQASAEFRALCYQAFNLARMNLDTFLASYSGTKPVAVIVDADETVIDNGAYEAFLIGQDFGYSSKTWEPWMAARSLRGTVQRGSTGQRRGDDRSGEEADR